MDNIIEPTIDYDFSKLYVGPPSTLAGGAYFTKLMYNTNKQLFIQTPKSLTKQGFVKSGKKIYADLMFDNNDTVFINWIENLETQCQALIFSKGQSWFETKLEKDDIESAFTSPFKIFKSGKYYLMRVNVKQNVKIYDDNDQIIPIETINSDKMIISILEIQGIKFTSRNFQIEIELKQSMVVSPDPFLDECFIKKPAKTQTIKDSFEPADNIAVFIDESAKILTESIKNIKSLEKSSVENPSVENPSVENPSVENPSVENPSVENPSVENPSVENPSVEHIDLEVSFEEPKSLDPRDELEEANIILDIEELTKEDPNILKEVDFTLENNLETITLKKPNQVYYEIYQKAREKAKEAKKGAIVAYLEMKNIKKTYMLDDIDESDDEFEDFASRDSASEFSDAESLEDN
jgi:hypothetical protein